MRLDGSVIRRQIENLLISYPELAEDEILRADMIEAETDLDLFLRDVERLRRKAVADVEALSSYIEELEVRQARFAQREEAMRRLMFTALDAANLRKRELAEATLSVRAGTPKVIITDDTILPDYLCRTVREPDKVTIKKLLTDGSSIPGAELSNAMPVLSIRTK